MSNKLPKRDVFLITFLGIYCLSVAGFAMYYFLVMYDNLDPQIGNSESTLMKLIVAVGVIAGVVRGAALDDLNGFDATEAPPDSQPDDNSLPASKIKRVQS